MPALPMPTAQTQAGPSAAMPAGRRDLSTLFAPPASFADSMVAAMAAPGGVAAAAIVPNANPSTASGPDAAIQIVAVAPIVGTAPPAIDAASGSVAPVRPDAAAGRTRAPAAQSGKDAGTDATVTDAAPQFVAPQFVTPQPVAPQLMALQSTAPQSTALPTAALQTAVPQSAATSPQSDASSMLPAQPPAPQSPILQSAQRALSLGGTKVTMPTPTAPMAKPSSPSPSAMPPLDSAPPGASPPGPQQPEQPRPAGVARADAGPGDRVQAPAASTRPEAPDVTDASPVKAPPAATAAMPAPADPGPDVLAHAAAGQVAVASAMPSAAQARTVVPADARVPPSAATVQVMPAMVSLATGAGGSHSMTLRLDPASLGAVQIRIDRSDDAPARVDITADRPETLALLQSDQHHLQQALDQAGVPAEGRQLNFHTAAPSPDSAAQPSRSDIGPGDSGQRQGQAGQNGPPTRRGPGGPGGEAALDGAAMQAASGWLRAGLDITA